MSKRKIAAICMGAPLLLFVSCACISAVFNNGKSENLSPLTDLIQNPHSQASLGDYLISFASEPVIEHADIAIKAKNAGRVTENLVLVIKLSIYNNSAKHLGLLSYPRWQTEEHISKFPPTLRDAIGNTYAWLPLKRSDRHATMIFSQNKVSDELMFKCPVEQAKWLELTLPADEFGFPGQAFRFRFPRSMVRS